MYQTSNEYKELVYKPSTKHLLQVYINGIEVEPKYILDFKTSQSLFENDEFSLGSVTAKEAELKLYKDAVPETIETIYITSGIAEEVVPIGYFHVETMEKEDDYTILLKLLDSMTNFEFYYDGSNLIAPEENGNETQTELSDGIDGQENQVNNEGQENGEKSVSLMEVVQDICKKGGVELRFYFFLKYGQTCSGI